MPELVLGPVLRYVDATEATVWVETDAACEVEILGCTERTFHVAGHHYAIVHVTGLEENKAHPYEVALDGRAPLARARFRAPAVAHPHDRPQGPAEAVLRLVPRLAPA